MAQDVLTMHVITVIAAKGSARTATVTGHLSLTPSS
jgi:hypothetical protein